MDAFRWISVAVSMILGIGVTRLLTSVVVLVRNRDVFEFDIVPAAWAAFIFVAQVQFWWAIIELATLKAGWTNGEFLVLISMPMSLFVAAALVLPHEPRERDLDLRQAFARDGRLALVALAVFNAVAVYVDARWWSQNLLSIAGGMLVALVAVPVLVLLTTRRRVQLALTIAYALLLVASEAVDSPSSY